MVSVTNALLLMTTLFNFGLATFIVRDNWTKPTNAFLAIYLFALSVWPLALIGTQIGTSYELWLYSAKATYIAGLIIAGSFYLFSLSYPEGRWPHFLVTAAVYSVIIAYTIALLGQRPFLVQGIVPQGNGNGAILEPVAYLTFAGIFCLLYLGGLFKIAQKYVLSSGVTRTSLLTIGLGVAITGVGGLYYDIILASPFLNQFQYIWTGPLFNTLMGALIVYAVFRLRFLNAKVIITELLIALLWIFTLLRTLLASEPREQTLNGLLFVLGISIGALLIRSVRAEVTARETIEHQEKELEVANKQQEGLLHFISHEIKGYLTKNEAAFAAIAAGDFGAVADPLKQMSQSALADTRKGVNTVMDILDASNLKKGTVVYKKAPFDLCAAVSQTVDELQSAALEKGIMLVVNCPSGPLMMDGDEEKIRRHVIRNIIDNAIKYTPQGKIDVTLAREGNKAVLTSVDTGVGITPEDMKRLFTEGGHGAESIKVNVHSTGYGLYIAKQIAEAHGGAIRAESEGKGKGSRFIVELPLA
jgi:signal transduction histidine kinase